MGVPQDDKQATRWCRLAAKKGNVSAQKKLDLLWKEKGIWGNIKDFFWDTITAITLFLVNFIFTTPCRTSLIERNVP